MRFLQSIFKDKTEETYILAIIVSLCNSNELYVQFWDEKEYFELVSRRLENLGAIFGFRVGVDRSAHHGSMHKRPARSRKTRKRLFTFDKTLLLRTRRW